VGKPAGLKVLAHWAFNALSTTRVVDLGVTWHSMQKGVGISTGEPSSKLAGMPNGQTERFSQQVLLPIMGLSEEARRGDDPPSLNHNSLISIQKLLDYDYTIQYLSQAKRR